MKTLDKILVLLFKVVAPFGPVVLYLALHKQGIL